MKTNQILKSPDRVIDSIISEQRTKDAFFNATAFLVAFNEKFKKDKKINNYLRSKNTKLLVAEVASHEGCLAPVVAGAGVASKTWMHPLVFIDFVMWLSPAFRVKALKFLQDNLIFFRNSAGDYYKEQSKELSLFLERQNKRVRVIDFRNEAKAIASIALGRDDLTRNQMSIKQLEKLDTIQKINIKLLKQSIPTKARHLKLREYAGVLFD